MTAGSNIVHIGDGLVRLSNRELHKRACKAIWESNHIVFESLPSLVAQIIDGKAWRDFQHKDFGSYALDATSNGLGINTNQRLWILRCSMDVHGKHIKEWADVLDRVEKMVRLEAKAEGATIRSFDGNSLETLAKNVDQAVHAGRITYLPSGHKHEDGHLVRLRKNNPDIFKRVVKRELSMINARKEAGMKVEKATNLGRAKSAFRNMTPSERKEFIAWLQDEGVID